MAELGERMTAGELTEWGAYEQVFGSLLIHERIDAGFAQVSYILAKAFGNKDRHFEVGDFMPPWFQELNRESKIQKGMAWLKGLVSADD